MMNKHTGFGRVNRAFWRGISGALMVAGALSETGCVTLPTTESILHPNREVACQIVTTWQPEVIFTPDPARGGMSAAGIGGRLYLFGSEIGKPLKGKGTLVVDLYDVSGNKGPDPIHLEQWQIDAVTLARLGKLDPIGFGYTLFLPWGTCSEEVNRVQLKVKYQPATGYPLYTDSGPITMTHPDSAEAKSEGVNRVKTNIFNSQGQKDTGPQIRSGQPVEALPFPKQGPASGPEVPGQGSQLGNPVQGGRMGTPPVQALPFPKPGSGPVPNANIAPNTNSGQNNIPTQGPSLGTAPGQIQQQGYFAPGAGRAAQLPVIRTGGSTR